MVSRPKCRDQKYIFDYIPLKLDSYFHDMRMQNEPQMKLS